MDQNKTEDNTESNELETVEQVQPTVQTTAPAAGTPAQSTPVNTTLTTAEPIEKKKHIKNRLEKLSGFNIYLLGFVLVLVLAGIVGFLSYSKNKKEEAKKEVLITEPLSQEVLDQLRQTDVRVGDPKQILSIESNAIFAGKVLVRDSLEVAGQLKIGGPLELPGIKVSGTSSFDSVQAKSLDLSGNANVQGQLAVGGSATVGGNLSVSGALTAGQLTIQNLQVSGDFNLGGHIDAGGGSPSKANGSALGGGGTSSVSGTDTAGSVNINTGGGTSAGCFVTLTFSKNFNSTPHVVITPVGAAAGGINYYINRSSSNFSICTASAAPSGRSFGFDYIVID